MTDTISKAIDCLAEFYWGDHSRENELNGAEIEKYRDSLLAELNQYNPKTGEQYDEDRSQ